MQLFNESVSEKVKRGAGIFGIAAIVALIIFLVLAEIASRGAARLFNREMLKQDMLRGSITVESISANLKGDVVFENLLWVQPDGDVILRVPEGSFHVRVWDVITRNFKSTTIQRLELNNALVSVGFNENMEVDFLEQKHLSPGRREKAAEQKKGLFSDADKEEETNFNPDGRKIKADILLNDCRLEARYRNRHYIMNNVNVDMKLDTSNLTHVKLSTGKFGGTMVGGGISVAGSVNFKPATPEMDLDVSIRDVEPDSLGIGMKLKDHMTLVTKLTGPVTSPVGRGTVRMKELNIPALHFTDVIGDVNYSNSLFRLTDVNAKVYGGRLKARGDYNLDTRRYNIYGKGTNLDSRIALRDMNFSCRVDTELTVRCDGNPRHILIYGNFKSGKGRYSIIPFDSLQGRFSNRYRELKIYDAKIEMPFGTITTDAFSIINGKLTLGPILYTDPDTGKVITIRKADSKDGSVGKSGKSDDAVKKEKKEDGRKK